MLLSQLLKELDPQRLGNLIAQMNKPDKVLPNLFTTPKRPDTKVMGEKK